MHYIYIGFISPWSQIYHKAMHYIYIGFSSPWSQLYDKAMHYILGSLHHGYLLLYQGVG